MLFSQSVEIVRPANTTAYAANDVIGPVSGSSLITFEMPSDRVVIIGANVYSDAAWEPTAAQLHLVTSSTYAPGADNAALTVPVYADGLVCAIQLSPDIDTKSLTGIPLNTGVITGFPVPVTLTSHRIYGALRTPSGFTPTSGQKFRVSLFVDYQEMSR